MSKTTIAENGSAVCSSRDTALVLPYGGAAHLVWVLERPRVRGRLESLSQEGANGRRRAGLPWREYGFWDVLGDSARIEQWRGEHRWLAHLLPPKLRGLVPLLVRDRNAPIEVGSGPTIQRARAERLQAFCLRKLESGHKPFSDAERQQLRRDLAAIDPDEESFLRLSATADPCLGATAAVSATSAALGSWAFIEPQLGYPNIGTVATHLGDGMVGITPLSLSDPQPSEPPHDRFSVML